GNAEPSKDQIRCRHRGIQRLARLPNSALINCRGLLAAASEPGLRRARGGTSLTTRGFAGSPSDCPPSKLCATLDASRSLRMDPSRPIRSIVAFAFVALPIAGAGLAALAETGAMMVAMDKMEVGAPPVDFEPGRTGQGGPAGWMVVSDVSAAGGRAIEQTSADKTDYRFPLAIYKPFAAVNVEVVL